MHRPLVCSVALVLLGLVAHALPASRRGMACHPDIDEMKAEYRRPPARAVENAALVELGPRSVLRSDDFGVRQDLLRDLPSAATAAGPSNEPRSTGDSGRPTQRKTQTLLGIGHARPPFDWDGRHATLEAQAVSSIGTGSMSMFATPNDGEGRRYRRAPARQTIAMSRNSQAAMPGAPINLDKIVIALAAFERTIEPGEAPFDRWIAGDETRHPGRGEARLRPVQRPRPLARPVIAAGASPTIEFHDVGTTTTDRGRGRELKDDAKMQFAFKTPTLRSVALRAPYMHDGSVATLARCGRIIT